MAVLNLKLCCVAFVLLLWTPQSLCREYTHEDIRDAIISVVHLLRLSEDKLERHEYREKALGDQLKKMLNGLDKKHRALEPMKGMISRMDDRLSNVETVLMQKAAEENATAKKTNEALDSIQQSLQSLTNTVQNIVPSKTTEIDNNLTTNVDSIERRLDSTDAKIDGVMREIENLKNNLNKDAIRNICQSVMPVTEDGTPDDLFSRHLSLLSKFEHKLSEYNDSRAPAAPAAGPELSEVALADEAWHSKMSDEMERQGKEISKVQRLLSDAEGLWKELPRRSELQTVASRTLDAVGNATQVLRESGDQSVAKMTSKLREMGDRLDGTNKDIQQSLTQGNTVAERAIGDLSRSYDTLRTELQALSKTEQLMLQTSDNVIAIKKRVDYGVQQILMQVKDLVLRQGKTLNNTFVTRLEQMSSSVSARQTEALGAVERDVSQVWRRLGLLHDALGAGRAALARLGEQSEKYVNSSTSTIGRVKAQVDSISTNVEKLTDNFNHVLGQMSLATHEFKEIAVQISDALYKLKSDGQTEKPKIDLGPGPHNMTSDETTP